MDTLPTTIRTLRWMKSLPNMALDPEATVAACRAVFAQGRATPATGLCLMNALFQAGRFQEAIAFAEENPRPAGAEPAWDIAFIHALLGANLKDAALARADSALQTAQGHFRLLRERAELLIRLKRGREAEATVVSLLEQSNQKLTPLMAKHLKENMDPAWLLATLDHRANNFLPGTRSYLRVHCLLALGRTAEALEWMDVDGLLHQDTLSVPDVNRMDDFHRAVIDEVVGTASFRHEPFGTSTRLGLQSSVLLNGTRLLPILLAAIRTAINRYVARLPTEHCFAQTMPQAVMLDAWMVRLGPGGQQSAHIHPSGWLSGVYYLATPDVDETAGALLIPTAANPSWPTRCVVPEPGHLVLFPSYFKHATRPHRSDQPRVCVAFDVVPRDSQSQRNG